MQRKSAGRRMGGGAKLRPAGAPWAPQPLRKAGKGQQPAPAIGPSRPVAGAGCRFFLLIGQRQGCPAVPTRTSRTNRLPRYSVPFWIIIQPYSAVSPVATTA